MALRWSAVVVIAHSLATMVSGQGVEGLDVGAKLDAHIEYARTHDGDAVAGRELFFKSNALACHRCHVLTGKEKSGPNLEKIGDKYERGDLIRSIVDPNQSIAPGYETTSFTTRDGREHVGVLKLVTHTEYRLADGSGRTYDLKKANVVRRESLSRSLMPEGLALGVTPKQFGDLITYLETLKGVPLPGLVSGGRTIAIDRRDPAVTFERFHSEALDFTGPVWFGPIPGAAGEYAVLEHQLGKIWRLIKDPAGDGDLKSLFLDLGSEISVGDVEGLMCLAFHPRFAENRRYFLKHERRVGDRLETLVVERSAASDRLVDSGESSRVLMAVEQPAYNHNGGCIAFGPDGMLYAAFGDGGPQRDPPGYSQNRAIHHGSMLRIDVDATGRERPFGIPSDNPWPSGDGGDRVLLPETWAYGFREPWRFTFDRLTGELWLGDVGQTEFEEIALVRRGENHGWNVYEGFEPFSDEYRREDVRYAEPVFAYARNLGVSVTGGYVYRGRPESAFYGHYIFGDYETRRVWALLWEEGQVVRVVEIGRSPQRIASFGEGADGELFVVGYQGTIFRIRL